MEEAVQKNIKITAISLLVAGLLFTLGMWLLYPDLPGRGGMTLLCGLFCLCILILAGRKADHIAENPIYSWILLSVYVIISIMLCFPNHFVIKYGLCFVMVIPLAAFLGKTLAGAFILGILLLQTILLGINTELFLQAFCVALPCLQTSFEKEKKEALKSILISLIIDSILVLLYGSVKPEDGFYLRALIMLAIVFTVALMVLLVKLRGKYLWEAFDYSFFEEPESPVKVERAEEINRIDLDADTDIICYSYEELCREDNTYRLALKQSLPNTYARELKAAELAKRVAGLVGADSEFVYCAVLYRKLLKFKPEESSAEAFVEKLKLTDKLKAYILKSAVSGWRPSNFEEIIAYTSCELISAYYYFKKQKAEVSAAQIAESVCTLLLKKGIVRDCLLSMSLFHKMKQSFMDNLAEFVGVK